MWVGVLLLGLVACIALLAAVLTIPVELRFRMVADESLEAQVRVEWLFGRVGRNLERSLPKPEARGRWPSREQLALIREGRFRARVRALLARCRRWVHIEGLFGRARVGLGDPAQTGMLMGWVQPLVMLARAAPEVDLRVEPDFRTAGVFAEFRGAVRAVPIGLVVSAVGFALTPDVIQTFWRFRSLRR